MKFQKMLLLAILLVLTFSNLTTILAEIRSNTDVTSNATGSEFLTVSADQQIFQLKEGWNLTGFLFNQCIYDANYPPSGLSEDISYHKVDNLVRWLSDSNTSIIRDTADPQKAGDWQRIISFDEGGAYIIDKNLPETVNTLHYLAKGYGYWIKMNKPGVFELEGSGDGYSLDAADGDPMNAVYVDGEGRVGIGTISPNAKLNVETDTKEAAIHINANSNSGAPLIRLQRQGENKWGILVEDPITDILGFYDYTETGGSGYRMVLDTSGNVGIGTMIPSGRLDVAGTVKATAFMGDGSMLTGISGGDASYGSSASSPNDAVYVDDSGNVGIGTTNPQRLLDIGNASMSSSYINLNASGEVGVEFSQSDAQKWYLIVPANSNDLAVYDAQSGQGTRVTFQTGGNVGIGTTNPGAKLDVAGNALIAGNLGIGTTELTSGKVWERANKNSPY